MDQNRFVELVSKEFLQELSEDDSNELLMALQTDDSLRNQYEELKGYLSNQSHGRSRNDQMLARINARIDELEPSSPAVGRKRILKWVSVAAAVVVLTTASFWLKQIFTATSQQVAQSTLSTPRGSKQTLTLPDGTSVILNAESRLVYPERFTGALREVSLIGEAFFDVHHDRKHPFVIHTDKMDVRVLGTAFNVKAYPNDGFSETTLIRGKVEVTLKARPSDRITLMPSEKLTVNYSNLKKGGQKAGSGLSEQSALPQVSLLKRQDTLVVETSWIYNKIAFADLPFSELAKRLERAYNVNINFKSAKAEALVFTGVFEEDSLEEVLSSLALVEAFTYKIEGRTITIN